MYINKHCIVMNIHKDSNSMHSDTQGTQGGGGRGKGKEGRGGSEGELIVTYMRIAPSRGLGISPL